LQRLEEGRDDRRAQGRSGTDEKVVST
jgi:hypothetical protein